MPISSANADLTPYEHVTIRSSGFAKAKPDDFAEHLKRCQEDEHATSFRNLGGDAILVVPCQRGPL
jgi:hypothetical protein